MECPGCHSSARSSDQVEGPLDRVAERVQFGVEARRSPAGGPLDLAAGDLVDVLGDGVLDLFAAQKGSACSGGSTYVGQEPDIQVVARVGEGLDEGQSIGLSPAVTSREQDEHRRSGQVRQGLDFGGQPAPGAARRVVGGSPGTIRDFL